MHFERVRANAHTHKPTTHKQQQRTKARACAQRAASNAHTHTENTWSAHDVHFHCAFSACILSGDSSMPRTHTLAQCSSSSNWCVSVRAQRFGRHLAVTSTLKRKSLLLVARITFQCTHHAHSRTQHAHTDWAHRWELLKLVHYFVKYSTRTRSQNPHISFVCVRSQHTHKRHTYSLRQKECSLQIDNLLSW